MEKNIKKNGIATCIISYMKQVASPGSMHDTGCLGLVHWAQEETLFQFQSKAREKKILAQDSQTEGNSLSLSGGLIE